MIVNYLIVENVDEIDQADRLGLNVPPERYTSRKMVIDINDVKYANITHDGHIQISIHNEYYVLQYDQKVWDLIVKTINERETRQ